MMNKITTLLVAALSATSEAAATIDKRVVGGDRATLGEVPFMVYLEGPHAACGGALLNSNSVLTAASCTGMNMTVARAGIVNRKDGEGGVEAKVASIKKHPDYRLNSTVRPGQIINPENYAINDIAIVKLATPIKESDTIGYAKLAADGFDPAPNSAAMAVGWGVNWAAPKLPHWPLDELLKVTIPIHAREDCSKLDIGAAGRDTIVCAGGNGKGICNNDNGGPLIDPETKQVVGIGSWIIKDKEGLFCKNAPSVFTRVGSYVRWINENSGSD